MKNAVRIAGLTGILLFGISVGAETTKAPELPQANKLELLQLENTMLQEQVKYNALNTELQTLKTEFQQNLIKMAEAKAKAFKDAGVSEKDYTLDETKLVFVAKSALSEPAHK